MKLFPQPITSPSRIEKYSPTLIRSIRSGNGRSKSRKRSSSSSSSSRLSPMFSIRTTKRNNGRNETQTAATLEPSSPKVNCCGEIRVKRSSSNQIITNSKIVKTHNHSWIQKVLFCKSSKTKKKSRPVWGEWLVCLQIGCFQKKVEEIVEDDDNMESGKEDKTEEFRDSHDDDKEEEISEPAGVSVSTSPPKNALLLMRCRSEGYYRPTSLAHLFWGSKEEDADEVVVNPGLSKDTKFEEKLGVSEGIESPIDKIESELKKMIKGFDQYSPRELRRSKSDPARISEEVINDYDNSLWKRR